MESFSRSVAFLCLWGAAQALAQSDLPVYGESLVSSWENWSWATTANSTRYAHGGTYSLSVTAGAWQAAYFHHSALDGSAYTNLVLWIHGGATGGQKLLVSGLVGGQAAASTNMPALPANTWQQWTIPLAALGVAGSFDFDGFWIQDRTGTAQSAFYLDDISLIGQIAAPPGTNGAISLTVDASLDRHAISPLIYGVAFASASQLRDLNVPLNRSGGNSESRYNWKLNAHNRGSDWYFESLPDSSSAAGGEADSFISSCKTGGADPMLTIPMVGWVAKLGANRARLCSYSVAKYGAQTGTDSQWFPDAGNGLRSPDGAAITGNDPNDANVPADAAFQAGWVDHLVAQWGRAGQGGVRYYFVDNEPSLWQSTHRDVHPVGPGMAEVRDKFVACAAMVKSIDPEAWVAGPEEWGWSGYFYSGLDQQTGATNGWSYYPDRVAHGGWDYLPWFLDQVRRQSEASGRRLLDLFSVHFYPQGGEFSSTVTTSMQARRNRSTRALWDPAYTDETWINDKVMLIPRLKNWVATYYPGTRIGITEYNWGAESHINGAVAQADVLGIFGREGLDLATRWTTPNVGTPVYRAIRLYRNYDGAGGTFGETSVRAAGANPDELASFASVRGADGALTVMLIHKRLNGVTPVALTLNQFEAGGAAQVWQLAGTNNIVRLADCAVQSNRCNLSLPAQSITLLVVPPPSAPRLQWGGLRGDGTADVQLLGVVGARYRLDRSADLVHWVPWQTNTLATGTLTMSIGARDGALFLRAVAP